MDDFEHAIVDIRRMLHDQRGSKAVVIVGAGFSRNAVRRTASGSEFPLWRDLAEGLAERLYPDLATRQDVLQRVGATSSALRLAQEFETAFGRPSLIEFLRGLIREDEFQPADVHFQLLDLPWADVFTTNFDCLLERASLSLWKQHYETVYSVNDLPLARRPRIVKLHGSFPELAHLVLTEEDYRTYPRRFAPFVANVQAALTENVVCLVGFSGDDPNFLAWSGWLRDELQNAVPRTYFFTGDDLKPFQRQLLEDRQIIAIPLMQISKADGFHAGYRWLFKRLAQRPDSPTPAWNVGPKYAIARHDPSIAPEPLSKGKADWLDTAIHWRGHRQHYKGWFVLHKDGTERLWSSTEFWIRELNSRTADQLEPPTALMVLREFVWRWSTALQPLHDSFVFEVIDPQLKRYAHWRKLSEASNWQVAGEHESLDVSVAELDEGRIVLTLECLRHAREIGDVDRFEELLKTLVDTEGGSGGLHATDHKDFICHQRILLSLGELQQVAARTMLKSWDTSQSDVIWAIRRGGLCIECGLIPLGVGILEKCLERVRSVPISGEPNIREMSAEGIILYLLYSHDSAKSWSQDPAALASNEPADKRAAPASVPPPNVLLDRLSELAPYGCDPNQYLQWLKLATSPEPVETQGYLEREGFGVGAVSTSFVSSGERQLKAAYQAIRFIEDSGLPLTIPYVVPTMIAEGLFVDATNTIAFFAPHEAIGYILRSRDQKLLERALSRKCVASLSVFRLKRLCLAVLDAMDIASTHIVPSPATRDQENEFWHKQFDIAAEFLGRIVTVADDSEIRQVLRQAFKLTEQPNLVDRVHEHKSLAVCVMRASEALSASSLLEELPTILSRPVNGSEPLKRIPTWHDPVDAITDISNCIVSPPSAELVREIDATLARAARVTGEERIILCRRLAALFAAGLLVDEQKSVFAQSLFAQVDEHGLPRDTGLLDSILFSLPQVGDGSEERKFREKHLSPADDESHRWEELHQCTHKVLDETDNRLNWSRGDLNVLLSLADKWLESTNRPPMDEQAPETSKSIWMRVLGVGPDWSQVEATVFHLLAAVENAVLLSDFASDGQRDSCNALIKRAQDRGWCVVRTVATRCFRKYLTNDEAVSAIQDGFGDWKTARVNQGCRAVVRWCDLMQKRDFTCPASLLQTLSSLIASRQHECLWLFIETAKDVLVRATPEMRPTFWKTIEPAMIALVQESAYGSQRLGSVWTIGRKLRIRIAIARLAQAMVTHGWSNSTTELWVREAAGDIFADVRREVRPLKPVSA